MLPRSALLLGLSAAAYETWWVNQSLDGAGDKWYLERVLINASFWNGSGPVLFYTGNEGPIDEFYSSNGWMTDVLAPKLGALCLFAEARYYGESDPGDGYAYLSTEAILADYAAIARRFVSSNNPVIAFGGSYGGTLTTFFRVAYPNLTVGGIASSAPVGYYDPQRWDEFGVDEYSFSGIVAENYRDCLDDIERTIRILRETNDLTTLFGFCQDARDDDPVLVFQYALESLPQLNYPYSVDGRPPWPADAACSRLKTKGDEIDAASWIINVTFGVGECVHSFDEGPGGVPGDGPGPGAWGKQSCDETLHLFSSNTSIRNYTFNLTLQDDLCRSLYGQTPNTSKLTELYGGYDIPATATNLFFSNGGKDPWHAGGFLPRGAFGNRSNNQFCFMPNAAHHLDLRSPHDDDPPDVTACRQEAEAAIMTWLAEAGEVQSRPTTRGDPLFSTRLIKL